MSDPNYISQVVTGLRGISSLMDGDAIVYADLIACHLMSIFESLGIYQSRIKTSLFPVIFMSNLNYLPSISSN